MSVFSHLQPAPADPVLGITDQFLHDPNPSKVNLGVGVYLDEQGKLPLLQSVAEAEKRLLDAHSPRGYLPILGTGQFRDLVKGLVFSADEQIRRSERVVTIQTLSGTGALRVGAELVQLVSPEVTVLVPSPSWPNHRALFAKAGFKVADYRYYDPATRALDFDGMLEDLRQAKPGTVVLLHACCHNPTGYDLSAQQWDQVIDLCADQHLVPFLDMAYQGFSKDLRTDAAIICRFAKRVQTLLAASSFSKNLGLYGERVGTLSVLCANGDEAACIDSQLKVLVRTNYSNPPTHGAAIVTQILGDDELTQSWEGELAGMRNRIKTMRVQLRTRLEALGVSDMDFITTQVGMFSYCGLNATQMQRLRSEYSIYGLDSGRICMAGLNQSNLDTVAAAIAAVR